MKFYLCDENENLVVRAGPLFKPEGAVLELENLDPKDCPYVIGHKLVDGEKVKYFYSINNDQKLIDKNLQDIKNQNIKIENIRKQRNLLLQNTDKYLLSDYPISQENLNLVKQYRQQLRDFMENLDSDNYTFPTLNLL